MPDNMNPSEGGPPTFVVQPPVHEATTSPPPAMPDGTNPDVAPAMPEATHTEAPPAPAPEPAAEPIPVPEEAVAPPPEPAAPPEESVAATPEPEAVPESPEAASPAETPSQEAEPAPAGPETTAEHPEDAPMPAAAPETKKKWYVVKVQSGREDSIKEAIERRVKIEGLEEYFGQIVIPVEVVTEMRRGKRVKKEHKLYPGYLMVEVEYNDRILYLFRETSGVGDFVGHTMVGGVPRPPVPMSDREVERMLHGKVGEKQPAEAKTVMSKPRFDRGDRLRVIEGTFAGMEGEVMELNQDKGQVKLQLTIFGRPVTVDLEYWQVEKV